MACDLFNFEPRVISRETRATTLRENEYDMDGVKLTFLLDEFSYFSTQAISMTEPYTSIFDTFSKYQVDSKQLIHRGYTHDF
jgi:hypothetical protein